MFIKLFYLFTYNYFIYFDRTFDIHIHSKNF